MRTPEGPGLLSVGPEQASSDEVLAQAWGAGAQWLIEQVPALLGAEDEADFHPEHPLLAAALHHHPNFRVGRTDRVLEAFVPACLEQRVTGSEAYGAFAALVRTHGVRAPGPAGQPGHPAAGMMVPPDPDGWLAIPGWEYLGAGVEQARVRPLQAGAARTGALERTLTGTVDPDRALRSLPGVGEWTSAEVRQRAHGDADAWSRGDYHIGGMITLALTGEKLDDDACDELLAPFAGHRYRVQMLIAMTVGLPERHGPRRSLPTHLPLRRRRR